MPLIKTGSAGLHTGGEDDFVQRMEAGMVLPIISDHVLADLVLGGQRALVERYAEVIEYPLPDRDDLAKMAKYRSICDQKDDWSLKSDYLHVVKDRLHTLAEEDGAHPDDLAAATEQVSRVSASEFASLLGFPRFAAGRDPLLVLANMPVPIYITTCSHGFMEAALVAAGRVDVETDYVHWHAGLPLDDSVLARGYVPTVDRPLVYHLFGVDTRPDSLVLTEDDYLRFLIALSSEKARTTEILPSQITTAFNTYTVTMLGFRLRSWAFRVIFWGLIKNAQNRNRGRINILVRPTAEEEAYLAAYLDREARFEVCWGDMTDFIDDLCGKWKC